MNQTLAVMRRRIAFLLLLIILATCGLAARLFYLQVLKNEKYRSAALAQRLHEIEIQPKRGLISDRNGKKLAINISLDSVVVNPGQIDNIDNTAVALASALDLPIDRVKTRLSANTSFEYIARKIKPEKSKAVRALKLDGIYLVEESERFYPNGSLAAHTLGFAGIDNQGLEGLEVVYDRELRGSMGRFMGETDAINREIPGGEKLYLPSEDGCNLILTVDEVLQHIAEREADRVMEETQAKGAVVVIANPNTAEILALCNRPTFDLNDPLSSPEVNRRNLAIWYNYEPGSTFKIVTAAAALEEGVVQEQDGFYCRGSMQVAGHNIACVASHGSQTFAEVVKNSCNVGFMTVGMRMPRETLYQYISGFGFGTAPGSGLPGEANGILLPITAVGPVEHANISFGQGIATTPLQMVCMMGAVANGGLLMKPQIVREIRAPNGVAVKLFSPQVVRQVVSTETASRLCKLLEAVVADGTGRGAQVPGYRLAGKTGTAQKIVDGRYVSDKHVASFVGFGPVDDPQLVVLILVDEPQGSYYGGVVAAPIFKNIMEDSLRYLSISPTEALPEEMTEVKLRVPTVRNLTLAEARKTLEEQGFSYRVEGGGAIVIDQVPPPEAVTTSDTKVILICGDSRPAPGLVTVPNLDGQTMRQAAQTLAEMGLTLKPIGTGLAVRQDPTPCGQVPPGTMITVEFEPPTDGLPEPG
ncbi:MAG TPA: penicillin-binding transpeptidase domain-containing protein [bacterium]|nr:penicillin-binding transpeptidase domain-containing protein [bacterium]